MSDLSWHDANRIVTRLMCRPASQEIGEILDLLITDSFTGGRMSSILDVYEKLAFHKFKAPAIREAAKIDEQLLKQNQRYREITANLDSIIKRQLENERLRYTSLDLSTVRTMLSVWGFELLMFAATKGNVDFLKRRFPDRQRSFEMI